MKRLRYLVIAFWLSGCAAGGNPLQYIKPEWCAAAGSMFGLALSSVNAGVIGTSAGAGVCAAIAGYFSPPNVVRGYVEMPVGTQNMQLMLIAPQQFVCPSNMTCTVNR